MKPAAYLPLLLALLPLAAAAQTAPAPTRDSLALPDPLSYYGFVDAYYGYDFRADNGQERPGFLYSHDRQNEFTVNQALIGVRYDDDRVRGALGLHAGSYVVANYAAEEPVFRHIYEAYAGFRPFEKAWLDVGIFGSHIGFESAISKDNWTLTRSLMAENSPYYEAGARLTYELGPTPYTYQTGSRLTLTALVLNGWQNIRETNQAKALGTQIQWRPNAKVLVNSSTFYGNEQPPGETRRRRYFHDFYLTYAATDRLSLALVFDVGKQQSETRARADTWHAGAALLRYKLADGLGAILRAEYYSAERGVIINSIRPRGGAADFRVAGGSLGLDYQPGRNVLVRLESRTLYGASGIFRRRSGADPGRYGNLTASVALSF
ncbi:porin [uncultured Hymenobacter sp.]|uniref:porin n=1 Tax=uncultured Hymenobacter sp. TaxID=170016 RepID=UPI0035CBB463